MNFTVLLARLAAQILLGIAVFLWGAIAVLDPARGDARWVIGLGPPWHWPPCCAWVEAAPGFPGRPPWAWCCPSACWHTTTAAHRGCGPCGPW